MIYHVDAKDLSCLSKRTLKSDLIYPEKWQFQESVLQSLQILADAVKAQNYKYLPFAESGTVWNCQWLPVKLEMP